MYVKSTASSRHSGLTLIEVVVGLALLSTLLVSLLMAQRRHWRQIQAARQKLAACKAADELLTGWYSGSASVPLARSGGVPNNRALRWRTRVVPNRETRRWGMELVRLTIHSAEATDSLERESRPFLTVDVVVGPAPIPESGEVIR